MYWDPFDKMYIMHKEMDRMFDLISKDIQRTQIELESQNNGLTQKRMKMPVAHVHETENNIVATFELPGVAKSDIDVRVQNNHIELKVEAKQEKKSEDQNYYEMSSRSYYRNISLPKPVDGSKAIAEYKNGILRVEVPKKHDDKNNNRLDVK